MALTAKRQKKLLNNATPGLADVKLGDIIETLQSSSFTADVATTSENGLMSAADKTKLDGVAASANNYTLPAAGVAIGGVKIGAAVVDATDAASAITQLNALLAALRTSGAITP